jgi:hypothetical protein
MSKNSNRVNLVSNVSNVPYSGKIGNVVFCSNNIVRILAYKSKKRIRYEKNL